MFTNENITQTSGSSGVNFTNFLLLVDLGCFFGATQRVCKSWAYFKLKVMNEVVHKYVGEIYRTFTPAKAVYKHVDVIDPGLRAYLISFSVNASLIVAVRVKNYMRIDSLIFAKLPVATVPRWLRWL